MPHTYTTKTLTSKTMVGKGRKQRAVTKYAFSIVREDGVHVVSSYWLDSSDAICEAWNMMQERELPETEAGRAILAERAQRIQEGIAQEKARQEAQEQADKENIRDILTLSGFFR